MLTIVVINQILTKWDRQYLHSVNKHFKMHTILSYFKLFKKHIYYMLGTVIEIKDIAANKIGRNALLPQGLFYFNGGK